MQTADSLEKSDAGKDWGQMEKRESKDEIAGWHHHCHGHELGQTSGDGEGQGGLMCWSSAAAAAAKSLQSCPTLCNPIDGSLPGSPVPGILQARTLEWGHKESDMIGQLNNDNNKQPHFEVRKSMCFFPILILLQRSAYSEKYFQMKTTFLINLDQWGRWCFHA